MLVVTPRPATAAPAHWLAGEMSEAGSHPRSLFGPGQADEIRSRLDREPYLTLFRRIWTLALEDHDPDDHEIDPERRRGNTARAAALVFFLNRKLDPGDQVVPFTNPAERAPFGQKASAYLLAMLTVSRAKVELHTTDDIHTAQELHLWSDTLDLLLGADADILGTDRPVAVQNVADLAADFYADYNLSNWQFLRAETANHRSKSAAALGIAAIVLNGEDFADPSQDERYDPARWIDFAVRNLDFVVRDILTDNNGGFLEGLGYLHYSGIDHVDFMWAWHNYTEGASYVLDFDTPHPPYYRLHASGQYVVPDMWSDGGLEKQFLWSVDLMLPDRTLPPFDDSGPGARYFYGALVRPEFPLAGLFRWAWEAQGFPASGSVEQEPLLLACFDDTIPAVSPAAAGRPLSVAMPWAGQVVFRSTWETDAVYALIQCEHGKAAGWAQTRWGDYIDGASGHEHPDGTAFMLYAYGESLALDSGYLGYTNHDRVRQPENHNVPLVDGKGAQANRFTVPLVEIDNQGNITLLRLEEEGGWAPSLDGMTYLVAHDVQTPGAGMAEVVTRYFVRAPDTDLRRRATFLDHRFLVVHDFITTDPAETGSHQYTFQLHGNGGGSSGGSFDLLAEGGLWSRTGARLRAVVTADRPVTFATRETSHDGGWVELTHTVLDAHAAAQAGETVEFLTLLAPERATTNGYETVIVEAGNLGGGPCPGPCIRWEAGGVVCEAHSGFDRTIETADGTGQTLFTARRGAFCRDATSVSGSFEGVGGNPDLLLTARFDLDAQGLTHDFMLRFHRGGGTPPDALVEVPEVPGKAVQGACTRSLVSGRWTLGVTAPSVVRTVQLPQQPALTAAIRLEQTAPEQPAVVPLGSRATLNAGPTCSADPAATSYLWRLLGKPEVSTLQIPAGLADATRLDLEPDLPGLYQLALTVTQDGRTSEARLDFEVEGEPPWPQQDAGTPDGGTTDATAPSSGCGGCRSTGTTGPDPVGTVALLLFGLTLLLLRWARRGKQAPTVELCARGGSAGQGRPQSSNAGSFRFFRWSTE